MTGFLLVLPCSLASSVAYVCQLVVMEAASKEKIQSLLLKEDARHADVDDLRTGITYLASLQVHVSLTVTIIVS